MAMEWVLANGLPLMALALVVPVFTLLIPACAAVVILDRLERGSRSQRRRNALNDALLIHGLYVGIDGMTERVAHLEKNLLRRDLKGESI